MSGDERDRIFEEREVEPGEFRFDERVARVFPDMIRRSIPGYAVLLDLIGLLARERVGPGSRLYDLGCSRGAVTRVLAQNLEVEAEIVGVDASEAMIELCSADFGREAIESAPRPLRVEFRCADLDTFEFEKCSFVVLNFTLQFLEPARRLALLERLRDALEPGGLLVLSEKTRPNDADEERFTRELHDAFRATRGYSRLEMARKREALERVLVPDTETEHLRRLERAGFAPRPWFRALQFVSWVAEIPPSRP